MTTEINDAQYNQLCQSVQKLFGLENIDDAAFIVNHALNFRDWLTAQYNQSGGEAGYVEGADTGFDGGEAGFDQGGEADFGGDAGFDGGEEFGAADDGFGAEAGFGDDGFDQGGDAGFGGDDGFGADGDIVFDDQGAGDEFGAADDGFGADEFSGEAEFGVDGGDEFSFDEQPAAPAPARQQARPAAPAGNSRPAARPAAPAPAAPAARGRAAAPAAPARGAAPAPARAAPAAPARAAAPAAPARAAAPAPAGDDYDKMKGGDLKLEAENRGLGEHVKEAMKGDAATKLANLKNLLRKFDKKVATISAQKDVAFLEGQMAKAGLKVAYGRGRATDERKKAMLVGWLIGAGALKL